MVEPANAKSARSELGSIPGIRSCRLPHRPAFVSFPAIPGRPHDGQNPPGSNLAPRARATRTRRARRRQKRFYRKTCSNPTSNNSGTSSTMAAAVPCSLSSATSLAHQLSDSRVGQLLPNTFNSRGPSGGGANTILAKRRAIDLAVGAKNRVAPALARPLVSPRRCFNTSWASSVGRHHRRALALQVARRPSSCRWQFRPRFRSAVSCPGRSYRSSLIMVRCGASARRSRLVPRLAIRPIVSRFQIDFQRHGQLHHARHFVGHELRQVIELVRAGLRRPVRRGFAAASARPIFRRRSRRWMSIIASLIRSAAEPWMTVLIAVRSGRFRWRDAPRRMPRIARRRPRMVLT